MKNKILIFTLILTLSSCSIFQKTQTLSQDNSSSITEAEDPLQKFVGNYEIQVLVFQMEVMVNLAWKFLKKVTV
ncbi:MAG: hypothetical protein CM15mP102_15310 [Flavobacteriales bacterium]|nr:MAG: hypothetical protein CM15mP102_15310 [Flavobacteriales bacterium]